MGVRTVDVHLAAFAVVSAIAEAGSAMLQVRRASEDSHRSLVTLLEEVEYL
jgi:hypothetical protein